MLLSPSFEWTLADVDKNWFWNLLTATADGWHAIVTSVVFLGIIFLFYRKNWRLFLAISIYCFGAVVATQLVKETLKSVIKEPRPYVSQMATAIVDQLHESNKGNFNRLSAADERITIKDFFANMQAVYNLNNGIDLLPFDTQEVTTQQAQPEDKLEVAPGAKPTTTDEQVAESAQPSEADQANQADQAPKQIQAEPANEQIEATIKALADGKGTQFLCDDCTKAEDIVKHFYSLSSDDREVFVKYVADFLFPQNDNLAKNQAFMKMASDNSYSLPSGHAIFAATWLTIFCYIALASRSAMFYPVAGLVFLWANGLSMSRVLLGYHYSHDVMASHILACALVSATFFMMLMIYRLILRMMPVQ